jgi:hypothetical protein
MCFLRKSAGRRIYKRARVYIDASQASKRVSEQCVQQTHHMSGHSNRIIYKVNWLNLKADLLQKQRSLTLRAADGEINSRVCVEKDGLFHRKDSVMESTSFKMKRGKLPKRLSGDVIFD